MVVKALLADRTLTATEIAEQVGFAPSTLCRAMPGDRSSVVAVKVCSYWP